MLQLPGVGILVAQQLVALDVWAAGLRQACLSEGQLCCQREPVCNLQRSARMWAWGKGKRA
eukprot:scaffold99747_cov18-Tisochrysis_lutea.AAC.1